MQVPTASLTIHPAAQVLPVTPETDPAAKALLESVLDLGQILEPLLVSKTRVVDGRLRLRTALAAGLDEVPVQEVDEKDVTSIVLQSLLARRHYTKSALAYLGYPLLEGALAESRKRRLANLKIGDSTPGKSRSSTQWTPVNTAEELAASLGVGRSFFFFAKAIHKKFSTGPKILRETWEPKILSGEMGLGEVQQAIAGKIAALDGDTVPKGDAQQLLFDLFKTATTRFSRWSVLNPKQRHALIERFRSDFLPSLPPELLEEVERFLTDRLATH